MGFPANDKYCFGSSFPMREPEPAAGISAKKFAIVYLKTGPCYLSFVRMTGQDATSSSPGVTHISEAIGGIAQS
jgi:hypothetical protein